MKLTLQSRIITYMVIMTVALVAIFTFIQLNNQLSVLTKHNIFKAKLGTALAKNALENALDINQPPEEQIKALSKVITGLKQSGMIDDADIIDKNMKVAASTNKYTRNLNVPVKEGHILKGLFASKDQNKQYQSHIDKRKKIIFQYVPLFQAEGQAIAYTAKIHYKLGDINDALKAVYIPCVFVTILIILSNTLLGLILSKIVIGPLKILNNASKEIAGGKLQLRINLSTGDEIEEVSNTFNDMAAALVRMKERAENANPLTKLPGNNVIHEEIEKRLNDKRKFVVVYSDLDNFKAFNDKYGIGAGDVAIKLTADIMNESLKLGSPDDFLGHEGGDDFVLLTTPEKMKAVTEYITGEFDKRIRGLYLKEDLDRGFIVAKSREGELKQFPIMTLSLAGVSNIERELASYGEITNICASVKKVAKKTPGSVFVLDKMPEH